ncbi:hypothetical protein L1987_44705 [Smallanthus sonchifolius]|uniref:Uncharacterized protein n=1 Tax=Smallanthus sonchifolius TaxID=185202 RepID=A0ACB9GR93_9ASTR|nr:hypothetical protein L1987_44705 [Smallanthus sonchifolius]
MANTPGVSATLFNALAQANINVGAIAQGCSEYNITIVIKREDCVIKSLKSGPFKILYFTNSNGHKWVWADWFHFT